MTPSDRETLRAKVNQLIAAGELTSWFETLYAEAGQEAEAIPWAHATTHPLLAGWLERNDLQGDGKRAMVLGCGIGDDAEKLAELGFRVTAFDISPSAIAWAKRRFPQTTVDYQVADLFDLPRAWQGQFDFVLEIFTVQSLPPMVRDEALRAIPPLLRDGGQLLCIYLGREHHETPSGPPWAMSKPELKVLEDMGLSVVQAEDFMSDGTSRRFRILYRRAMA